MAKRPDYAPEKSYRPEQLSEIRRNSAMLSKPSLQTAYAEALERCKLARDGRPPKAEHIQVFVQAWRPIEANQISLYAGRDSALTTVIVLLDGTAAAPNIY